MKSTIFAILILGTCLSGCTSIKVGTGYGEESYTNSGGKSFTATKKDRAVGIRFTENEERLPGLMLAEGTREKDLAKAEAIRKDAETRAEMMKNMKEGKIKESSLMTLGVTNNDKREGLYFFHPEISGLKIYSKHDGGFGFAEVTSIPNEVVLFFDNGAWMKVKIDKTKSKVAKHRNGMRIDNEIVVNKAPTIR